MNLNGVIFIGGIHGVGKSSICRDICRELNIEYLSASELLKWEEINEDPKNKKVKNIPDTQERLLYGLKKALKDDKYHLLDGHYCLLNSNNKVENIPLETFKQINPSALILILDDVVEIKNRLEKRDKRPYDYGLLESLQNEELAYAKRLSKILGVGLHISIKNDYWTILAPLRKTLSLG